ncbi:hypothetical protein [Parashewanella tropica]|uniref:hypothetical protein n=1 Tax=Parashewanella tropica TaxID=2547970 RepID=UPI0010595AC0|nr:hypothetical protein [Parashewanella tropica]
MQRLEQKRVEREARVKAIQAEFRLQEAELAIRMQAAELNSRQDTVSVDTLPKPEIQLTELSEAEQPTTEDELSLEGGVPMVELKPKSTQDDEV